MNKDKSLLGFLEDTIEDIRGKNYKNIKWITVYYGTEEGIKMVDLVQISGEGLFRQNKLC